MPKLSESKIKAALSAAEKEARAESKLHDAVFAQIKKLRRQEEKVLRSHLTKTGFPPADYERIRSQNQTEMRRLLKTAEATAIKRSSSRMKDLRHQVERWRERIERFRNGTVASPWVPAFDVIETPFIIWPTNNVELDDSHIQPWNNTAKVRGQWDGTGTENLRFIFVWENPNDRWVLVNVESNLAVNGFCDAFAVGGFIVGSINSLFVQATLKIWEWWNNPPTNPLAQAAQTRGILSLALSGGGVLSNLGGGHIHSKTANGVYDLRHNLFSIPPHGVVVFEVTLEFLFDNDGGGMTQANFSSGDFQVKCPAVVIAFLS